MLKAFTGVDVTQVDITQPGIKDAFLDMQEECFPEDDPMAPVQDGEIMWFFAYARGEPVGFACLTVGYKVKQLGYLAWAGVMKEYRGRGIQRLLIQARVTEARLRGLKRCITYTVRHNPASSNNLIKEGFQLYLPSPGWDCGPEALYWRKRL